MAGGPAAARRLTRCAVGSRCGLACAHRCYRARSSALTCTRNEGGTTQQVRISSVEAGAIRVQPVHIITGMHSLSISMTSGNATDGANMRAHSISNAAYCRIRTSSTQHSISGHPATVPWLRAVRCPETRWHRVPSTHSLHGMPASNAALPSRKRRWHWSDGTD